MTRSKGYRNRSRKLLTKRMRERGLPAPSVMLRRFSVGDKVVVNLEPSVHKGMPHRRFQGRQGVVREVRGRAYVVEIPFRGRTKYLTARGVHLASIVNGEE